MGKSAIQIHETQPNTDTLTLDAMEAAIRNLVEAHWLKIKSMADDQDAEGKVSVNLTIKLDFDGKVPIGAVNLSYASKTKDAADFRAEDPQQPKLGIDP